MGWEDDLGKCIFYDLKEGVDRDVRQSRGEVVNGLKARVEDQRFCSLHKQGRSELSTGVRQVTLQKALGFFLQQALLRPNP